MSVALRLLGSDDAALLDHAAEGVLAAEVRPDLLAALLADSSHLLLVALDGDLVVGLCAAMIHRRAYRTPELYVDELMVSPPWQRRGIGRSLMRAALDEGRARGCRDAWLATEPDNVEARALYDGMARSPAVDVALYVFDLGDAP